MVKGTSWAEATSNREKIKPVAVTIVCRHQAGRRAGRRVGGQAGRQLVSRKFWQIIF